VSVLCIAPASPGMLPGVSADAQVPVGPGVSGVVVPASAVVWWQGRAWAYVERKTGTFSRSEVATDVPVPGGWFVSGGVAAGQRLVVRGAQMLLSEEGRGAVHGSEG
jgi:multidrug efflux pump subunit AcrA (membrane-fusion protein)